MGYVFAAYALVWFIRVAISPCEAKAMYSAKPAGKLLRMAMILAVEGKWRRSWRP